MKDLYKSCKLCPRNCGVDRTAGKTGFCGESTVLRVGTALIHCGEEPPLVGANGSGTIFISGCNLGCAFCQNYQISQGEKGSLTLGREVTAREFAGICTALRDKGAQNINIVTGSHAIPGIIDGLEAAKEAGVKLPVLWNSSGYENTEALELLNEHVDIYLPDLKTLDSEIAAKYFNAPDYPEVAAAAIKKMIDLTYSRLTGSKAADLKKKVIIRHLILPGYLNSTRTVLRWFADNAKDHAMLSLMTQYTPIPNRKRSMPKQFLHEKEYDTVMGWLDEFEIEDGFCQELITGSEWLPDFKQHNPFSSELSIPVWHYTLPL